MNLENGKFLEAQYPRIQLYITIAHQSIDNLFDFKTERQFQQRNFQAMTFNLNLPKDSPVYYFFHKNKHTSHLKIEIERRKQCTSKITHQSKMLFQYRLLGGVVIYKDEDNLIFVRPLKSTDILQESRKNTQITINQEQSKFKPHIIVRTFKNGYPLRTGQTFKLGKLRFYVTEVSQSISQSQKQFKQGDVLQVQQTNCKKYKQTKEHIVQNINNSINQKQQIEEKQCKFCFNNEQSEQDFLIAACQCKGSSKFVHINCLKHWLEQKNKCIKLLEQDYELKPQLLLECDVCKQKLPKIVRKGSKSYFLLDILKQEQKFVSFQHLEDEWNNLINRYMIPLSKEKSITIGRKEGHTVELFQSTVSRQHALIYLNQKDQVMIKDTCSKFGTLVYDPQAEFKLGHHIRAFQIENMVFSFKLIQQRNDP